MKEIEEKLRSQSTTKLKETLKKAEASLDWNTKIISKQLEQLDIIACCYLILKELNLRNE